MSISDYFRKDTKKKKKIWISIQKRFEEIKAESCSAQKSAKYETEFAVLLSAIFNAEDPAKLANALYLYYEAKFGIDDYYDTREFGSYAEAISYDIRNYFTDETSDIGNHFSGDDEFADGLFLMSDEDWDGLGLDDLVESLV